MTTATPWASDPPADTALRVCRGNQTAHTPLIERFRLLSMHSFPHLHPELFAHLCERPDEPASTPDVAARPFEPQLFTRWEQLLRESERITGGVVLLDLDEAENSASLRSLGISAHRLCDLLARELHEKPVALVLLTRLDYVEIEDLLHTGVAALLHPLHDVELLAERVHVALRRRHAAHAARLRVTEPKCADVVASEPPAAHSANSSEAAYDVAAQERPWTLGEQICGVAPYATL